MPLEPREYSRRLGVLTHEQLQAALDRFDLGTLLAAEPAPGGLFGQNVMITSTAGEYVLRGNPHPGQMEREQYVAGVIRDRTSVPAPWPYLIEDDPALFGWPYAVMPRLPGVQLADGDVRKTLGPDDRANIVAALADCLAALHHAAFEFVGVYDEKSRAYAPAATPFAEWWPDWTRWWLERCRAASPATTGDDVAWVEGVLETAREAMAQPFTPALVHTDFKEANAVAQRTDGSSWQITGIFDLAETHLGDGEYDLARAYSEYRLRGPGLARLYVRRYLESRPPRPGFAERFQAYVLHDRMIIWEYGQRNGVWFTPGMGLREWAAPLVAAAGDDARASESAASSA